MFRGIHQEDSGVGSSRRLSTSARSLPGHGSAVERGGERRLWNSLHSGPSGNSRERQPVATRPTITPPDVHVRAVEARAVFTSYTSPNYAFQFGARARGGARLRRSGSRVPLSPKAILAFELDGQADGGTKSGTYLELGVYRPVVKLIDAGRYPLSLAIPLKLGVSVRDYYEGPAGNQHFGYFDRASSPVCRSRSCRQGLPGRCTAAWTFSGWAITSGC